MLLSPEDTFFSLALHKRRFGRALSLKNVLDSALLLSKYKDKFDWDYIITNSNKQRMNATVFFMLSQIRFLLDMDMPLIKKIAIAFWKKRLINRFIEKNTFSFPKLCLCKDIYTKTHFLLYDSIWEGIYFKYTKRTICKIL